MRAASRSRSCRRRRSGTSASPTATASSATSVRARGSRSPLPLFFWTFRRAAERRDADVVHAHWLPSGAVAATLRKPYVVQVWGTDVELARRVPRLARPILRRARLVLAASRSLGDEAHALGARDVRVVPSGVELPRRGRGAAGTAARALRRTSLAREGRRWSSSRRARDCRSSSSATGRCGAACPVRSGSSRRRSSARGSSGPPSWCVPSRREGYGVVARQAMAWGGRSSPRGSAGSRTRSRTG